MCTSPSIYTPTCSRLFFLLSDPFFDLSSLHSISETMPIALEGNGRSVTIARSEFIHAMRSISNCDRSFPLEREADSDSSSSSSIGRNSDPSGDSSGREDSGESEVQSSFNGPFDTINALEEALPVKRGISRFYSGKSKSFTSLADGSFTTSIQDIVKPEDPYAKKRKNLLAHNFFADRRRNCSDNVGGVSKRSANLSRGTSCSTLSSLSSSSHNEERNPVSTSPPCSLPPLHPHAKRLPADISAVPPRNPPWRSYSWSDLQSVFEEAHDISGLAICSENKGKKLH